MSSTENDAEASGDASVDVLDTGAGVRQLLLRETRNRLSPGLRSRLRVAIEAAACAPEVHAIVLGTAGAHFSVGGDVATMQQLIDAPASRKHAHMLEGNRLAHALDHCRKPLVAAVSGGCHGAGAGLMLLCDTIVVGVSTQIGFPFLRMGLVPDFGISHTLGRRVGDAVARQILLYAGTVTGGRALEIGLADECVADDLVLSRAVELATQLAKMPAHAMGLTKDMLSDGALSLETAMRQEAMNQAQCFGSADMREGVAAFFEKRAPRFNESKEHG